MPMKLTNEQKKPNQYQITMKEVNKFFGWSKKKGVIIHESVSIDELEAKLNTPLFLVSSFKNRSAEIKQLYNHKFNSI